jgi:hypothetical protein
MQILKRWSVIALQRFYPKVIHLFICFAKKEISLTQYMDTHYKMTIIYLCMSRDLYYRDTLLINII